MQQPRILAFAGSLRRDSWNRRLVGIAAAAIRDAGGLVTELDLRDFPMPLYDADLERSGTPDSAVAFKRELVAHQALLLACPEYNSSITAVLKNAIDWASRRAPDEAPLAAFQGKVAALVAASPGALGGLRGLVHVRAILGNLGVLVLPEQLAVVHADRAIGADGLADEGSREKLAKLCARLVGVTRAVAET